MRTSFIPPHICPQCQSRNDAASHKGGHVPQAGNISICAYCGLLTIFTDDLDQRELTPEEMTNVQASPQWEEIAGYQSAIREKLNVFKMLLGV